MTIKDVQDTTISAQEMHEKTPEELEKFLGEESAEPEITEESTDENAAQDNGDTGAAEGSEEPAKTDVKTDQPKDSAQQQAGDTGVTEAEKWKRTAEEKEKMFQKHATEVVGVLRPAKALLDKFKEDPDAALEYYAKLKKEKYGDQPSKPEVVKDEDVAELQDSILNDDKSKAKQALYKITDNIIAAREKQNEINHLSAADQEAEKINTINENKNFLVGLNPDLENPEMVEAIKEVMIESGVTPENVEKGLKGFFLLPPKYTGVLAVQAKERLAKRQLEKKLEETKGKAGNMLDKINATARTMKGVNAASGQALPKSSAKNTKEKESYYELSPAELQQIIDAPED